VTTTVPPFPPRILDFNPFVIAVNDLRSPIGAAIEAVKDLSVPTIPNTHTGISMDNNKVFSIFEAEYTTDSARFAL
jgi:hypothetical protein